MCLQAVVKTTPLSHPSPIAPFFALREAFVLANLAPHPNVVPLLDIVRTTRSIHTVLGLAPGYELYQYVDSKPNARLPEEEACLIVAGILEALRHVHSQSVLHRDVKLDNVFYDPKTGQVTLLDFGLATFVDESVPLEEDVGCLLYASPGLLALALHQTPLLPQNGHSDLWSLGVLAHGILTGYFPFSAEVPALLEQEIKAYAGPALEGFSEPCRDFVRLLLDPANAGRITADALCRHPWVARFSHRLASIPRKQPIPRIPSPVQDLPGATRSLKAHLSASLRVHFRRLAGLFVTG